MPAAAPSDRLADEYTGRLMPPRIVSLLLAFVLLWSLIAVTQQRFAFTTETAAQDQHQVAQESRHANFSGSIDDHQVDDQPSQTHGEQALDWAAPLASGDWNGLSLAGTRPSQAAGPILPSPDLKGPQRPPRAAGLLPA